MAAVDLQPIPAGWRAALLAVADGAPPEGARSALGALALDEAALEIVNER